MTSGLISCVLPTFNRWHLVETRLKEIALFKHRCQYEIEVVLVDDCSDLPAPQVVREIIDLYKWKIIRLYKNSGCVSIPRNVGIVNCSGDFIMHIDDDVKILESKFSILPKLLMEGVDLIYAGMIVHHQDGRHKYSFTPNNIFKSIPL